MGDSPEEVRTSQDPTKAVLSESGLNSKHLCDYVVNVATGCRHGCKFCYVPSTPNIRTRPDMLEEKVDVDNGQKEWGQYVLYREGLGERLDEHLTRKQKWRETRRGQGVVGVSFSTDCYMDGRAGGITRNVVEVLSKHNKYTRVLTRNPILALQDLDVFTKAGAYVTIGSSIPCMDADQVGAIEPRAPSPEHRLRGLQEFNEHGVQTFISLSPTYPTQNKADIRDQLERIASCDPAVVFHEPINPRGGNFGMTISAARDAGEEHLADELDKLRNRENWVEYSVNHLRWVQEIGQELGLPVHLWPDKQLIKHVSDQTAVWLQSWRDRQSPERFAKRDIPRSNPPSLPATRTA